MYLHYFSINTQHHLLERAPKSSFVKVLGQEFLKFARKILPILKAIFFQEEGEGQVVLVLNKAHFRSGDLLVFFGHEQTALAHCSILSNNRATSIERLILNSRILVSI